MGPKDLIKLYLILECSGVDVDKSLRVGGHVLWIDLTQGPQDLEYACPHFTGRSRRKLCMTKRRLIKNEVTRATI